MATFGGLPALIMAWYLALRSGSRSHRDKGWYIQGVPHNFTATMNNAWRFACFCENIFVLVVAAACFIIYRFHRIHCTACKLRRSGNKLIRRGAHLG